MRSSFKDKKRIVFKVGTSTITHEETGGLDLVKLERFIRILTDLHNQGKDVIVVSSGAIGVGRKALGLSKKPDSISLKQACAAIGQSRLMTIYQKLFSEYNQFTAQILMTKFTIVNDNSRHNARNTFEELLKLGVIPIVNENDTVATDEIDFGDNDSLSAVVAAIAGADLLVLLSDIDGMYTDDPNRNPDAELISYVESISDEMIEMAKGPSTTLGTGGMSAKIYAAGIANDAGADMAIINGEDMDNIIRLIDGEELGTVFKAHRTRHFHLKEYLERKN
ncbi:MAG: glutamate 5-kinase [Eubacterium sp.]|nr:glutamate 5-kinase [Eubacterium sp.]MCI9411734.1 glutamate 5-kinase [Eubacterium sp.]